jgi:hypothetical protein
MSGPQVRRHSGKIRLPRRQADHGVRCSDPRRPRRAAAAVPRLLGKCNLLREFALEGVRDFVLRAKILGDAVAQNDAPLAALATEGGARVEAQRRAYAQARSLDARSMEEAILILCRCYGYLDRKLRELTAAIRAAL